MRKHFWTLCGLITFEFPAFVFLKCLQLLVVWMEASPIPDSSWGSQHQEKTFTYSASILMQQPAASREFLIILQDILLVPAEELQHKHTEGCNIHMWVTPGLSGSLRDSHLYETTFSKLFCYVKVSLLNRCFVSWVINICRHDRRELRQIKSQCTGWRFPSTNICVRQK